MTSEIKVNTIKKSSGSTITIGESGDTVSIATGATSSGFGAISWVTDSIKTADFTAVAGKGYFVNTTGGVVVVTLPASPSVGDMVAIKDYAFKFGTNKITVNRNGVNLDGVATNKEFNTDGTSISLIYIDATKGWSLINDDTVQGMGEMYVAACGGNTTLTVGNYKTHVFTSPGNFVVSNGGNSSGSNTIDYLIVAGGGGGGQGGSPAYMGGAGGAGGFRISNSPTSCLSAPVMSPLSTPSGVTVSAQTYPIVVGAGGADATGSNTKGSNGSDSSGFSLTAAGGGFGAAGAGTPESGGPGGSGGGSTQGQPGGTGNTPPVSPAQGQDGGQGQPGNVNAGGGGGGAGAVGGNAPNNSVGGTGGIGSFISDDFFGPTAPSYGTAGPVSSTRYFAGGGLGSSNEPSAPGGGTGGLGGGGKGGGGGPAVAAGNGTTNTGGGGGGGSGDGGSGIGGDGGSGIVVIRYKFQ